MINPQDKPFKPFSPQYYEKLLSLIRGGLSEYYNQTINTEILESLTHKLIEDIEKLMNTDSQ